MSLRDVSVDLDPLTIFVGPNGSGKSAVFKGLVTFARLLNGAPVRSAKGEFALEPGVTFDDLVWSGNSGLPIRFKAWFEADDDPSYVVELRKGSEGWSIVHERLRTDDGFIEVDVNTPFEHGTERRGTIRHQPPLRASLTYLVHPFANDSEAAPRIHPILAFAERFGKAWKYRPSASDIASFVSFPTTPGATLYVRENGWGLAAQLQALQGSKRDVFSSIERAVCTLFSHVRSIGFNTDWQGVRLSFLTNRSQDMIPAPQESDGVLLATFLFWRLFTSEPSLKVCLEEPENGLHPFLLADRFRMLKEFAYGESGLPRCQLLISTHSPEFLRAIRAHPMDLWKEIRLVEHNEVTGTSVKRLSRFHEAHRLIDRYLDDIHERWAPVVRGWQVGQGL